MSTPPKLSRVDLLPLLRPGQEWLCAEGGELVIILSIDVGTMYPVLYEWSTSKHEGRDSADGFIRDFRPADPIGFLASLQAALATLQAENAELRKERDDYRARAWTRADLIRDAEGKAAALRERLEAAEADANEERDACEQSDRRALAAEARATAADGERDRLRELLCETADHLEAIVRAATLRFTPAGHTAALAKKIHTALAAIPHTEGEASAPDNAPRTNRQGDE